MRTVPIAGMTYELFENYSATFARQMPDNDTSFMVETIAGLSDTYAFSSHAQGNQLVTITVVPDASVDNFDLDILAGDGSLIATSSSTLYTDFVQLQVIPGQQLMARVRNRCFLGLTVGAYRLIVVGSTPAFGRNLSGVQPYMRAYTPR